MAAQIEDHEIEWFRDDLMAWYEQHGRDFPWRRTGTSLYQHVIAEILLQRTRAETLSGFYKSFIRKYDDWSALASVSVEELEQDLKPVGLATQRAPRINSLAQMMVQKNGRFPEDINELQALPAIGQYVAYAIQTYRGVWRLPLLDTGMARVIERCFGQRELADIRYDPQLQERAQRIVDSDGSLEVSWAILDLAALVCRPSAPNCDDCPVKQSCEYAAGEASS